MKRIVLITTAVFAFAAFQSCNKCGHCHREVSSNTLTNKYDDDIYCGNNNNESGSYSKEAKLNCEAWAGKQTAVTGVTYSSSWVSDK
jgi:hypothetical protein